MYTKQNTNFSSWFERNRSYIGIFDISTDETILELWDEDLESRIEDGFINPKDFHASLCDYANETYKLLKNALR